MNSEQWPCGYHKPMPRGEPFCTFSRSDQGPDNPLRQAFYCPNCCMLETRVISTERKPVASAIGKA